MQTIQLNCDSAVQAKELLKQHFKKELCEHYFSIDRFYCYYEGSPFDLDGKLTSFYGEEVAIYSPKLQKLTIYKE